ncbi:maleate cis-trans isomerase family protein [Nocardiopsis lambiniae]|uniref:Maleate cis-trans isomerase n=1 Tax=Nocardiopsis lambiniae TaxID=3075539 RepID=A0ABU2MBB8_9ACTN|nr:maleate cis-trans isomerase [Nocardiopsis sp. DSM 44743]MDT0329847.1 maleate cis-trans isomerase [Nocardiopsis sp. DSM 44743]
MTRVGFLYPGSSAEDDYKAFEELLGKDVELPVVHTPLRDDRHRLDTLLEAGSEESLVKGAQEMAALNVEAVVQACAGSGFVHGWKGARRQVEWVRNTTGTPASSTSCAFVHALARLRLSRVAIAATYPDEISQRLVEFLSEAGVTVVSVADHDVTSAAEVAHLDPNEVLDFVISNDHPRAETVLVPDTALHSAHLIDPMEALLGKTVLTANQVSVWEGLRLAGRTAPRAGGPGMLFRAGSAAVTSVLPPG